MLISNLQFCHLLLQFVCHSLSSCVVTSPATLVRDSLTLCVLCMCAMCVVHVCNGRKLAKLVDCFFILDRNRPVLDFQTAMIVVLG